MSETEVPFTVPAALAAGGLVFQLDPLREGRIVSHSVDDSGNPDVAGALERLRDEGPDGAQFRKAVWRLGWAQHLAQGYPLPEINPSAALTGTDLRVLALWSIDLLLCTAAVEPGATAALEGWSDVAVEPLVALQGDPGFRLAAGVDHAYRLVAEHLDPMDPHWPSIQDVVDAEVGAAGALDGALVAERAPVRAVRSGRGTPRGEEARFSVDGYLVDLNRLEPGEGTVRARLRGDTIVVTARGRPASQVYEPGELWALVVGHGNREEVARVSLEFQGRPTNTVDARIYEARIDVGEAFDLDSHAVEVVQGRAPSVPPPDPHGPLRRAVVRAISYERLASAAGPDSRDHWADLARSWWSTAGASVSGRLEEVLSARAREPHTAEPFLIEHLARPVGPAER